MAQVAARYGVTTGAILRWLKTHELLRETNREGKYRYMSPGLVKRYLRDTQRKNVRRVAEKPDGYVGLYEAREILGTNFTVIYRAVRRGDVDAVRLGHTQYYREEDIQELKRSVDNTPPEGWEMVKERASRFRADVHTVTKWLIRKGFETGKHRSPERQIAVYAAPESLDAWQQHYLSYGTAARERRDSARALPANV